MPEYTWIKENADILTLIVASIGVLISIITFWFLRWQGYERGEDLRNFLFHQELVRGTLMDPGMEEILEKAKEGSKHQWIKKFFKKRI